MPDRVVVTGAGGYVGRHVVKALLDQGHHVIAVVRPASRSDVDPRAEVIAADILSPGFSVRSFTDDAPDGVVHLAWQNGFLHNDTSHVMQLSSHFRLLEQFADWGVPRLSILGTMHEVGYWEGPITEDTPTNPLTLYGIAKDALRKASFVHLAGRTQVQWLRCYYILGDDRNNHSIFTRILEAVDRGDETFPFTTGKNKYDFIDVVELADQIARISAMRGVSGIINTSSGVPLSLAERVEAFIAENRLPISLEYGAFPDRPYDSPGVWGDTNRTRALLDSSS